MTARAIPKNASRVIDPLRQRLVFCVLVSADNNYRPQVCHPRHAWWALDHHAKATLRPKEDTAEDVYVIQVNSAKWFELSSEPLHTERGAAATLSGEAAESLAFSVDNDAESQFRTCEALVPEAGETSASFLAGSPTSFFIENERGETFIVTVAQLQRGTSDD